MTSQALLYASYAGDIVESLREPLLLLDADLRIVLANPAFTTAFGGTAENLQGRSVYDIGCGAWGIPQVRDLLERILPSEREMRDFKVVHAGPPVRTLLLNARRLAHQEAQAQLILLAFEDASESERLRTAVDHAMAELERSNHELEAFASVASHDLQEPLRKIIAFGERLETTCGTDLPEKGRDYLARMTAAAARMQRLINDLLMLSRVTRSADRWREVALSTIVAEVLGDLEVSLQRSGGRVDCGPLPVIHADATQMRQLFQNLIGNALKFRGPDPSVVTISASAVSLRLADKPLPGDTPVWRITISDNGIGFESRHAERIFRPFERLHARSAFEGTGIGLAISRRIVQRHGGTIRAESEPGAGSRFILHLPARQRELS